MTNFSLKEIKQFPVIMLPKYEQYKAITIAEI